MASLSEYFDGVVEVPLRLLTSDGFAECPSAFSNEAAVMDFNQFLNNPVAPITGIVTPDTMLQMLRAMGVTLSRFRETRFPQQTPLVNEAVQVGCLLGTQCLTKAQQRLGDGFKCLVKIYCIPPDMPGQYSDGQILQQIFLHHKEPGIADKWLHRLKDGKQRHIRMLMGRRHIWCAMQKVARFPGLWEDIQIGNFAKHLAAHIDESIVTYWNRIDRIWSGFFQGLEAETLQLEVGTVRFLQYKAPGKSKKDLDAICKAIESKELFPDIHNENHRAMLYRNITKHNVIIPSILSFHENMRFITLGVKILERNLLPPNLKNSATASMRSKQLLSRLTLHRVPDGSVTQQTSAHGASLVVLATALANFASLSSEAPLQEVKGRALLANPCRHHIAEFCRMAMRGGFQSETIMENLRIEGPCSCQSAPKVSAYALAEWRGGKPTVTVYHHLKMISEGQSRDPTYLAECPPAWVLQDILSAFFDGTGTNISSEPHNPPPQSSVSVSNHQPSQQSNRPSANNTRIETRTPELSVPEPSRLRKRPEPSVPEPSRLRKRPLPNDRPVQRESSVRTMPLGPPSKPEERSRRAALNVRMEEAISSRLSTRDSVRSIPITDHSTTVPHPAVNVVPIGGQAGTIRSGEEARARRLGRSVRNQQGYVEVPYGMQSRQEPDFPPEEDDILLPDREQDDRRSDPGLK